MAKQELRSSKGSLDIATVSDFRTNIAKYLNDIVGGDRLIIVRGNDKFILKKFDKDEEQFISPNDLVDKVINGIVDTFENRTTMLNNKQEIGDFMNGLKLSVSNNQQNVKEPM